MAAVTICSDFEAPQNKVWHCFHCLPIYFPWSDGTRCHDLRFLMLSFKPTFSLSSFTFIKRIFSSSSRSAIRVVSSAYLRLLIFLLAILIPAYASSSLVFLMMYSACKLNKQGDNIQPWRTPFPIWNQSVVTCPVLTVDSWLAYKFLKEEISLLTTQKKTLHMDITRWSTPKSDWLYSLQPKMEKLYTVNKNKTRSWLWHRSWTPYCPI